MLDDLDFLLVAPASIFGTSLPFDFAVCSVRGDAADISFVSLAELRGITDGRRCVPSVWGGVPGIVSSEAEVQAFDMLVVAASEMEDKYVAPPPGYEAPGEPGRYGIRLNVEDGRLSAEFGQAVMAALGWHEGDRISLVRSPDGTRLRFFPSRDGGKLVSDGPGSMAGMSRTWSVEGLGMRIDEGEVNVAHWIDGHHLVVMPTRGQAVAPLPSGTGKPPDLVSKHVVSLAESVLLHNSVCIMATMAVAVCALLALG